MYIINTFVNNQMKGESVYFLQEDFKRDYLDIVEGLKTGENQIDLVTIRKFDNYSNLISGFALIKTFQGVEVKAVPRRNYY